MATPAERMRAHRERARRRLRRADGRRQRGRSPLACVSKATKTPQAPTRTADPRLSAVSLVTPLPVSTAPAETLLQPSVAPSHRHGAQLLRRNTGVTP